jgi:hypothetical protein
MKGEREDLFWTNIDEMNEKPLMRSFEVTLAD